MEDNFIPPTQDEAYKYFLSKLGDEAVSWSMSNKFMKYYITNDWQIKTGKKKWTPMKSWKGTINTWIRNIPRYNAVEKVKMVSKRISDETQG